jgi:hypothetical protein
MPKVCYACENASSRLIQTGERNGATATLITANDIHIDLNVAKTVTNVNVSPKESM